MSHNHNESMDYLPVYWVYTHLFLLVYLFSQSCIPPLIHLVRGILGYAEVIQYWATVSASNAPILLWYIKVWMQWEYTDQTI